MSELVSILIPAYNSTHFEPALSSALSQTYDKVEIVICDDSPDLQIENIVNRLCADISRVRYFRNAKRRGGGLNYDECIKKSKGVYLKFLNDDDVLASNCVERLVSAMTVPTTYRIGMASSRRIPIDENGNELDDLFATVPLVAEDSEIRGADISRFMLFTGQNVVGEPSTTLFRREDVSEFKTHLTTFEGVIIPGLGDMALWLNLLRDTNLVYLSEALSYFRIHSGQRQKAPEIRRHVKQSLSFLRNQTRKAGLYTGKPVLKYEYRPVGSEQWKNKYVSIAHFRCLLKSRVEKLLTTKKKSH